jgi:hypothetical protein
MTTTNEIPSGTVAAQTVNLARDKNKPATLEFLAAEIDLQANCVGPVLEEILKAGHTMAKPPKPMEF